MTHQFDRLLAVIRDEHPKQAALMREYNYDTRQATLGHLRKMLQQQPLRREEPLWMVKKGHRVLHCVVIYLPAGADLRLLENGEFRRTVLFRNGDELEQRQREWKAALLERGWSVQR